ncbi:hypothetical protein C8R47DRAFT_1218353 [Mycena vitilis]|nr:hypothetical protein C8R47DRAFT_1218353 [Mycena vitilis]
MQWSDTVGEHDVGTLSIITLSVSLLGGATGNTQGATGNTQGSSRPGRGKATVFFSALKDGAAEPEPTRRRRKVPHRSKKDQGEDSFDGGEYSADLGDEDEDSDKDMLVDGSELADSLPAKTDPKAGRTRSKDTGKSADKGKGKSAGKPPKKKRKTARTSLPIVIDDDSEKEEPDSGASKATKKAKDGKKTGQLLVLWVSSGKLPSPGTGDAPEMPGI